MQKKNYSWENEVKEYLTFQTTKIFCGIIIYKVVETFNETTWLVITLVLVGEGWRKTDSREENSKQMYNFIWDMIFFSIIIFLCFTGILYDKC